MIGWLVRYKRAMENVCCREVVECGIHSHEDYQFKLRAARAAVLSLRGDNSPQFNREMRVRLDRLLDIMPSCGVEDEESADAWEHRETNR